MKHFGLLVYVSTYHQALFHNFSINNQNAVLPPVHSENLDNSNLTNSPMVKTLCAQARRVSSNKRNVQPCKNDQNVQKKV